MPDANQMKQQMDALHLANMHFASAIDHHLKEFKNYQAVDDLLSLNASLASSSAGTRQGGKHSASWNDAAKIMSSGL